MAFREISRKHALSWAGLEVARRTVGSNCRRVGTPPDVAAQIDGTFQRKPHRQVCRAARRTTWRCFVYVTLARVHWLITAHLFFCPAILRNVVSSRLITVSQKRYFTHCPSAAVFNRWRSEVETFVNIGTCHTRSPQTI